MTLEQITNQFLQGDTKEVLKSLPDKCVNMCVTSPPYWALRTYNVDGQYGQESTPEEYVQNLVEVFSEVKRVLRDDGTLWLNLGDTYAGKGHQGDFIDPKYPNGRNGQKVALNNKVEGYKRKDMIGIPWMVAFALRSAGWYLRQDIIWEKPNTMPSPAKDRCVTAHEYIFLLSKKDRYYFDYKAIQEDSVNEKMPGKNMTDTKVTYGVKNGGNSGLLNLRRKYNTDGLPEKRNKRSVWSVNTQPFPDAHFAVFPPKLIEPCIMAGCPVDGIVLDPFMGSGTTAYVALKNGRNFVGVELNAEYIEMAKKRIELLKYSDENF